MKASEIRAEYVRRKKKIIDTARRLEIANSSVHKVINGDQSTRYIQEAIAEDIEQTCDQVFPVTKEEA